MLCRIDSTEPLARLPQAPDISTPLKTPTEIIETFQKDLLSLTVHIHATRHLSPETYSELVTLVTPLLNSGVLETKTMTSAARSKQQRIERYSPELKMLTTHFLGKKPNTGEKK